MTTTDTQIPDSGLHAACPQPVDRARRARFIGAVVGFCLIVASMFAGISALGLVAALYLPIVEMFIGALMSLAMATTLAYVGGSVVDYNGGIGNMFTRPRYSQPSYSQPSYGQQPGYAYPDTYDGARG